MSGRVTDKWVKQEEVITLNTKALEYFPYIQSFLLRQY